jgi:uncharacterized membrane protein YqaE (UPF0057 family)
MKNKLIIALALVFSATLITSCSIEKRHYMSGYYVGGKKSINKSEVATREQESVQGMVQENNTVAAPSVVNEESVVIPNATGNTSTMAPSSQNSQTVVPAAVKAVSSDIQDNAVAVATPATKHAVKSAIKNAERPGSDVPKGLLIVLCFLLPWLAVGLVTDWDVKALIINLLLCLTCIGGIIHALIVVNRNA